MGIPRLFKQICSRYPMTKTTLDQRPNYKCNNLFIDATALLIEAMKANPSNESDPSVVSEAMIEDCLFLFNSLVHLIQPTDLIFISIEGSYPNAKLWQGRQREYLRKVTKFPPNKPIATLCLDYEQRMIDYFKEKAKTDEFWGRTKIIYSGIFEPGEAEQKFINYIRTERSKPSWNPNQKHCIFTPDSDLILLALQTHEPFTTVCYTNYLWNRNPGFANVHGTILHMTPESLNLIDINLLREFLMFDMKSHDERIIDDFIAIMTVLGTDFYPHPDLGMFSIDLLVKCYHSRESSEYIVKNGSYNMPVFKDFLLTILNKVAESRNLSYDDYCEEELEKFTKRNCSPELERELSYSVLDAFNWTLTCYTSGIPSWGWAYKSYFAPPLCLVAEYIDDYKPSFRTDDPLPCGLYDLFISSRPKPSLLPENLFALRETDPYMKEILPSTENIEKDEFSPEGTTIMKVATVDYARVMKLFKDNCKDIPEKFKKFLETRDAVELKTGEKICCTKSNTTFRPINLSKKIPESVSLISSFYYIIQTTEEKTKFGVEKHIKAVPEIPSVSSAEILSFYGKIFYVNWPYRTPAVVVGSSSNPEGKTVAGFELPAFEPIASVQLLDSTLSHTIGKPFDYPAGLLIPIEKQVAFNRGETVTDSFIKEAYDDRDDWISIGKIAHEQNIQTKYLLNAVRGVYLDYSSYSLQLLGKNYVIPGFTKLIKFAADKPPTVYVSKDVVPNIVKYVKTVPEKFLENPLITPPDYSVIDIAAPLILELAYKTPWIASQNTASLSWRTFRKIEEQKDKVLTKDRIIKYKGFTSNFRLGQHVMIITDKTVAPKGTIGTVVANDPIYKELWLVCHDFEDGFKYVNTLESRSGLVVSYTHVMAL